MNQNEVYQFLQLYEKFMLHAGEDVKITDLDPTTHQIELQFLSGPPRGERKWYDFWYAAKTIVAHGCGEVPDAV
jgi:hypothetical protein